MEESTSWQIEISNPARRDVKQLSAEMRRRVLTALEGLTAMPKQGDIKKLKGSDNEYRLRVGDWRVIFELDNERRTVKVLAVPHRSDAYRD